MRRASIAIGVGAALLFAGGAAVADDAKLQCIDSHTQSQQSRRENHLRAAREKLVVCAAERCPAVVRKDCATWLAEVETALPSVVISAKDASGAELRDVTVTVDGEILAKRLDGNALLLDPGIRRFHYEAAGLQPIDQDLTIRAGERNREIRVTLKAPAAPGLSASPPPPVTPAPIAPTSRTPALAYVLAGVGVVGLAGFGYFGLDSSSKKKALDDQGCKPRCAQSDVDAVKKDYLLADISLGVGVLAVGAAAYLLLTSGKSDSSTSERAAATTWTLVPSVSGAGFVVRSQF